ncbi:MAG: F0F1 ATP synthase subunit gamma, partial [Oscillospiraceae bacterium]|nr:F0F1 ATP synthase subunit gamma [Oscillospiraceae bacterium]
TGKLSKAMKTVSAAKMSRLSSALKYYSAYAEQFSFLYRNENYEDFDAVVMLGSNRGFCGGFNSTLISYFKENIKYSGDVIACGDTLIKAAGEAGIKIGKTFSFPDVPKYDDVRPLLSYLYGISGGELMRVCLVYPKFVNTMVQEPCSEFLSLNMPVSGEESDDLLWLPERKPVMASLYEKGAGSILFGAVLKTALGAQAATLMTMRSAYDTAVEYTDALEGEIHRLRQSEVTSDVIETSSERGAKGDASNG